LGPRWGGIFDPGLTPKVGSSEGEPKVSEAKQGMKRPLQIGDQKPEKSSETGICRKKLENDILLRDHDHIKERDW